MPLLDVQQSARVSRTRGHSLPGPWLLGGLANEGTGVIARHGPECVVLRDLERPWVFRLQPASLVDTYYVGVLEPFEPATSVLVAFEGANFPLPIQGASWQTWLPELDAGVVLRTPHRQTAVAEQLEEIQRVTGLSDTQLAAAFPGGVSRETVNRWRNRPDPNLRPENVYRLGLLYELAQRMGGAGIDGRVWLHQPVRDGQDTPFSQICAGRLGDVRNAVEAVAAGLASPHDPMQVVVVPREQDVAVDGDDEGEWVWEESAGDAGE
jgi:hypothetical protein